MKGKSRHFQMEKIKSICCQLSYLKIMANGSSLNKGKNKKNLKVSGRKKQCDKQHIVDFLSHFLKLYLTIEIKIMILM